MKLHDLGFEKWFKAHAAQFLREDGGIARVSAVDRGAYLIRNESGEVPAELSGKLSYMIDSPVNLPCVGDWVTAKYYDNDTAAVIHGVLPRKTFLRRKTAGARVCGVRCVGVCGVRGVWGQTFTIDWQAMDTLNRH
jgi:ribosome biogenesis GTPase